MTHRVIQKRKRFFVACEGQGEQALVRWIQHLADQAGLHIHLDTHILNGGGYESMLETAKRYKAKGVSKGGAYVGAYVALDADRAVNDGWTEADVVNEFAACKLTIIYQRPNLEGLLLRLFNGKETAYLNKQSTNVALLREWPEYEKNFTAQDLQRNFTLEDLFRMASHDPYMLTFLRDLGFTI